MAATRKTTGEGQLLRIFIGENDKHAGQPLYEWIVRQAMEQGLAGATVLRGLEGFGAHSRLHTAKVLRLATDLPLVVEIVDTPAKIDAFLPTVDAALTDTPTDAPTDAMITLEKVEIIMYRSDGPAASP